MNEHDKVDERVQRLWTPWRMSYVGDERRNSNCIFCAKQSEQNDIENLILYRGKYAFIIMNLYPYNTGHVMAVPYQHIASLDELDPAANADLFSLLPWVTVAQRRVLRCDGFNIGLNIGSIAGAGIADHLHIHVVPRWQGDANFMPLLANTMVLPELIPVTYAKLRAEIELSNLAQDGHSGAIPQAGAVVLLPSEGKVAFRRAKDGSMVLPKGHIDDGEAAYQTALREIEEEMGLRAQVTGWAGMHHTTIAGQERSIAYLIAVAERGASFPQHLGRDTFLFDPADAIASLTHDAARELLRSALAQSGALSVASDDGKAE
jgi:ATP adenylyltransferase